MTFSKDTRTVVIVGAGLAVLAAVAAALMFGAGKTNDPNAVPPAAEGGLKIDLAEAPVLEPTRELRCFVDGQFIGMSTLSDCARRNGVASSALDVGLDSTGALAAAPTASFSPPPVVPVTVEKPTADKGVEKDNDPRPAQTTSTGGACLRHVGSEWRQVGSGMTISACVQALYAGSCVRSPGEAQYGRWNETSLRLVPRRVEQSTNNVQFRTLATQDRNCQFPDLQR